MFARAVPLRAVRGCTRQIHSTVRAQRTIRVLGLESSADDACAAVVTSDREILSSAVCKQHDINRQWGGIHPIAAHEAHLRDMVRLPKWNRRGDATSLTGMGSS